MDTAHFSPYLLHLGLEAGLNISNIIYSHSSYFKGTLTGLNAGITIDIPVEFAFSFYAAVVYSQKGYNLATTYGNYAQRLNFIDVPVLLKKACGHGNFNFIIGPQLSFLASSKKPVFDNEFKGNQGDYGYAGGSVIIVGVIGESLNITRFMDIHARYTIDIGRTRTNTVIPAYHNQAIQVGFGFRFN